LLCSIGWTGKIEVEAHVVTIRNAAAADDAGLLNPLLKRWQDQACSQMVFGLPAVQSVINFKWDRCDRLPNIFELWLVLVVLHQAAAFLHDINAASHAKNSKCFYLQCMLHRPDCSFQSRNVYFNSQPSSLHWKSKLRNVWGQ